MKQISLFIIFCWVFSSYIYSQDTLTIYFDKNWNVISDKDKATFYGKGYRDKNKLWAENDYYISNKIQMKGFYRDNNLQIKHGNFIYYYENGQKSNEGEFINNNKDGEWKYWYENGELSSIEFFKNGILLSSEGYFENGQKKYSGQFNHGLRNGQWTYWGLNGKIAATGEYKNGKKNGEWIRFFRDGEMKLYFKNDIIEGKMVGGIVRRE